MKHRVVWAAVAERDLSQVWSFIERNNAEAAEGVVRAIEQAVRSLAETPELGIRMDHIGPGLRCKPVRKRYLVFYKVEDSTLFVMRVLHGARSYEQLF